MTYQEKIYVAYDGANDHNFYEQMQNWQQSDGTSFDLINGYEYFSQIDKVNDDILKEKLFARMNESKVCVLLIGQFTKSYRRFVRWQIELLQLILMELGLLIMIVVRQY